MTRIGLVAAVMGCVMFTAAGAMAQSRSRPAPRSGSSGEEALPPSTPPQVSTLEPVRGISGPRLQPGAVLCGAEQDLQHRAEVSRRISDGDAEPGNAMAGCRMINEERGVDILARHGLGRIQVKLKPSGEIGWTDAYFR